MCIGEKCCFITALSFLAILPGTCMSSSHSDPYPYYKRRKQPLPVQSSPPQYGEVRWLSSVSVSQLAGHIPQEGHVSQSGEVAKCWKIYFNKISLPHFLHIFTLQAQVCTVNLLRNTHTTGLLSSVVHFYIYSKHKGVEKILLWTRGHRSEKDLETLVYRLEQWTEISGSRPDCYWLTVWSWVNHLNLSVLPFTHL